jgi:hypothetical protein
MSAITIFIQSVLEERRNQINETVGEFQRQLQLSYLKHKHLGENNTPSKIDERNQWNAWLYNRSLELGAVYADLDAVLRDPNNIKIIVPNKKNKDALEQKLSTYCTYDKCNSI